MPFLNNPLLEKALRGAFSGGMGDYTQSPQTPPFAPPQTAQPSQMQPMAPAAQPKVMAQPPPTAPLAKVQPTQPNENEIAQQGRFNDISTHGSGISQIHNPVGRTLLTALDAIGSGLFPRIAMNIPGTQAHHNLLLNETQGALEHEQKNRQQTSTEQEQAARAGELETRPELAQVKHDLETEKLGETTRAHQATEDINRARNEGAQTARESALEISARRAGYRHNAAGELEAIPEEEMTPQEFATVQQHRAQTELADATADLRRAQAKGDTGAQQLAARRLELIHQRLGLSQATYNARYLGTDQNNQPLPGSMLTDDNRSVGSVNAPNVRPTGTERTRADLASSAQEQLQSMRQIVQAHPEYFGPGAGPKTEFVTWVGSQDPDAQRFRTARTILADHAAGVFGARSEYASRAQEIAAGQFKDNPDAILAGLGQIETAMKNIGKKGTVRTAGSEAAKTPGNTPAAQEPKAEGGYKVGTRYGGLTYLGGPVNDEKSWKK